MEINNLKIDDNSGDKRYFTIIPNFVLNHSTHWDREVYIQMKKIAGEKSTCWMSQKNLANQCDMSVNRLKKSIKYLLEHNWIKTKGTKKINTSGGDQFVNEYEIVDLWQLNNRYYKGVSRNDTPNTKGVSPDDTKGYHENAKGVSPEGYKEEPTNKNLLIRKDEKLSKKERKRILTETKEGLIKKGVLRK